jgi:hypothetical protein
MTQPLPETEYTIESETFWFTKVLKISGKQGEVYTYSFGKSCSPTLGQLCDLNGDVLVEFHNSYRSIILELSGFQTNLSRLRLKVPNYGGHRLVGKVGTVDFNWELKNGGCFGSKYNLVDITNGNQTLATINGKLCCKNFSILLVNGVPSDFHKVIIALVAFIWRLAL